ncbi:heme ABC exporter ATP-binding protein CcmA [Paraurantiacibacter namhicola]|uniref:Cytochrome c biogenesis ATP-binding export protein CcmA n=1 Tax=Paraurantiacibacter namhicola TaxID=645517 RepID=A0A1C7DB98_9SPHN|nr:heme ABC exporter ATP-binding protein CcmA [Paraurantiacibacter namhicola]ANU08563.1 Cytochrome c biogenesis ATP-binding export protein CcmA [Paraurantiacibacter namhicola]
MEGCRLQAHEIACLRGERLLFRGLTLGLKPGEALQVTGANGTGKSSLIRILAGLMRPTSGQVIRRCDIALLDERPALDPDRPLGEALAFWQRMDGGEMPLERLGLDGLLDVPVRYLSTGQTKRAALARMIGQGAPVWLLDEPLNGLDADAVTLAEKLVAEHCASGGIAVVASHQAFALRGMRYLAVEDYVS